MERFIFAFNGVKRVEPMSMERAIDRARERAMQWEAISLGVEVPETGKIITLGHYGPSENGYVVYTGYGRREERIPNCEVDIVPFTPALV